jgi:uncharacterized membrane protein
MGEYNSNNKSRLSNKTPKILKKTGLIALISSLYVVLTVPLGTLGYSWIQVRISESLTPLPFLLGLPAVIGLYIGSLLANLFSPVGLIDVIIGPILTLIAAFLSWKACGHKRILACLYPMLVNSFGVSWYLSQFYGVPYALAVVSVGAGESIATILLGYPLLRALEKFIKLETS